MSVWTACCHECAIEGKKRTPTGPSWKVSPVTPAACTGVLRYSLPCACGRCRVAWSDLMLPAEYDFSRFRPRLANQYWQTGTLPYQGGCLCGEVSLRPYTFFAFAIAGALQCGVMDCTMAPHLTRAPLGGGENSPCRIFSIAQKRRQISTRNVQYIS